MVASVEVTPEEARELQRRYRMKRRRWAWSVNRPYSQDLQNPPPGVTDAVDSELG